ncbi:MULTISPECIES: TetR/AcrR family transcriptional regulator [Dactylosporangium]|uniref:TetR family transcriptional regulator n=2 Tax=Dactylosporangium TaxID=35753 RepID=A0A9W6NN53_9ACTN|nr:MULTISPECIES: TetR/AcrR family transcriptional regulator [Dactylosporangium]UAB96600.1 TetR/AcrR family transcriptional regulator [Dactylosporangium vinaceum]UWZ44924.1 TetR/AcrR family transcriptional regulator [Dactylosporangium matsuzakiense]GLL03595.1 TetR family transcriptional regulator [Dactylosporangium matsuzakiense]
MLKRLPRVVREQQMLDAAVKVFAKRGFHAASMDEIAEVAGISKPMVYAYLGPKEDLFLACLQREATRLMEAVAAGVVPTARPDEQLWNGLRAFFAFVGKHRDGWQVLYRQSRSEPVFAGELDGMRTRIVELVAGLLEGAWAQSTPGRPVAPDDFLAMAFAYVGAAESLADWLADHADEDPDRTATRMMNFVWIGADGLLQGRAWKA